MLLLDESDRAAIRNVVGGLEASWNKGSASEYVRHFAVDADFVNIYGAHGIGRELYGMRLISCSPRPTRTVMCGIALRKCACCPLMLHLLT